jgi:hypothetical protein
MNFPADRVEKTPTTRKILDLCQFIFFRDSATERLLLSLGNYNIGDKNDVQKRERATNHAANGY